MREAQTYQLIAQQSYDTIPKEVGLQIELNPNTRELRFLKLEGTRLMYNSSVVDRFPSPTLDELTRFAAIGRTEALRDLLQREFDNPEHLPYEVRVIRPNPESDFWGVFVRR